MTKEELIGIIQTRANSNSAAVNRAQVSAVYNAIFETMKDVLVSTGQVKVPGFGVFEKRDRAARIARNLRTGAPVNVPAGHVVRFRPSQDLKEKIKK
jgi:DNA-binding protein HU-beta